MKHLLLVAVVFVASAAQAQTNADAQYPAPVNTFEIDAGHKYDYLPDGKSESYYRISYKGAMVRSEGTPFKQASGLDLPPPTPAAGAGDVHQLLFRFEQNKATVGGGLFEASGVQEIAVNALSGLGLRGNAFAGGDADGKVVQLAIGLETAPWRIPGFRGTPWSNWLVLGVNAQRQEATDTPSDDKNFGLLTYRAFAGRAFGWRKSADVGNTAKKIADQMLKLAPTHAAARRKHEELKNKVNLSVTEQLVEDVYTQREKQPADWEQHVLARAHQHADKITDQPTVAVYFETSGWYSDGTPFGGSKLKNLFTATVDYFFMPQRDDFFLRGRFENGYERATPTERKKHLLVSVGMKF